VPNFITSNVDHKRRAWLPAVGVVAVGAVSLAGAAFSVAAGLSPDLAAGLGPTARLAAPLPMLAAQLILGLLAGVRHRAVAAGAAALLGTAGVICVASGLFDGGYGDARLTAWQQAYQGLLVAVLAACGVLAFVRLRQVLRRTA
jgi:hypothetical protein